MKIIGKLDKIQEFFLIFFNKAEENNINEIKKHKEKLLFGNINYYDNNKIAIDYLIKKYELIAKKFLNEFKSAFYKKIYESNKIKFINENESYWLDKTENDFNELKNAIIVNDFNDLNEYILNMCSDTIKDKNEKELKKEIDILIQIFDINNIKKNNLNNSLNNFFNFIEIKYIIPKANEEISHKKEFIGEGGFGHVYLIQYYQKKYALKEINLKLLNEEEIKDCEKETDILSHLNNNDHIVKYYNSYKEKDNFCIIMEYAGNVTLKQYIENHIKTNVNQFMEEEKVKNIVKQICLGLKEIHDSNIIHRDLKPENIFIDENNKLKIGDFGISKISKYAVTKKGTIGYMAPEMMFGDKYDNKVDIYALGCIIYELITLQNYYKDKTYEKIKKVDLNCFNPKWQELIDLLVNIDYQKRPNIEEVLNYLIYYIS